MLNFSTKHLLLSIVAITLFASCIKTDYERELPNNTVVVYIAAENNLENYSISNINQMEEGYKYGMGNLLVFWDSSTKTEILQIKPDVNSEIVSEVVWSHDKDVKFNSVNPENMNTILTWVIDNYPAKSYGLILWSHGLGWYPGTPQPVTKWFGQDTGVGDIRMDILDFDRAIPDNTFDYIAFDACFMGTVEVAWELKNKAEYVIAAPTEILAAGFPYKNIVPALFQNNPVREKAIKIAEIFYDNYNTSSGTIGVYHLPEIIELANQTKNLINSNTFTVWNYNATNVQRMDRKGYNGVSYENYMYDFLDFFEKNFPSTAVQPLKAQLEKFVIYKAHTPGFLWNSGTDGFEIKTYCGVSVYLPKSNLANLNAYYRTLGWTAASDYNKLLGD